MTENPKPIKTGGPPKPKVDKPVACALHELLERIRQMKQDLADIELEANEIKRSLEGNQEESE